MMLKSGQKRLAEGCARFSRSALRQIKPFPRLFAPDQGPSLLESIGLTIGGQVAVDRMAIYEDTE